MTAKTKAVTRVRTEVTFDDGTVHVIELAAYPNDPITGEWNVDVDTVRRPDESGLAWVHEPTGVRRGRVAASGRIARTETVPPPASNRVTLPVPPSDGDEVTIGSERFRLVENRGDHWIVEPLQSGPFPPDVDL